MKPLLLTGGVLLLLLGLLLLIVAVVMYFVGRNKQTAAAGPRQPMPPQQPYPQAGAQRPPAPPVQPPPMQPPPPRPHQATAAPPPSAGMAATSPTSPIPQAPGPGGTDATVVAERISLGSLHATSGPLAGQSFPLKMDGFYIGRDRTVSQVVIESPSVSKRHVWVGIREGYPTVVDQSSTNGTYLNTLGTRIGQVRLSPGDTIIISDDVARFVYKA